MDPFLNPLAHSPVQEELTNLIRVSWILLIPIGVLVAITLYKVVFLLHSVSEFVTLARYELAPVIRELRLTADHLETLSAKMVASVETVERGVKLAEPVVNKGVDAVRTATLGLKIGLGSLVDGIQRSFLKITR